MKSILALIISLISINVLADSVEIKNEYYSIKSSDMIHGGELNSNSYVNPKISGNFGVSLNSKSSLFIDGSYQYFNLKNNIVEGSLNLFELGAGYRIKPEPQISFSFLLGGKNIVYFNSNNGQLSLLSKNVVYFGAKSDLALTKIKSTSIIVEGSGLFYPSIDGFKGSKVGTGISIGFKDQDQRFNRLGYKIDYESTYNNLESNSFFIHGLYYKINF